MENRSETKNCQNCKKDFVIEQEDFNFYEKIKVPSPTFCPECRFQRRLMFMNERVFYRRECEMCKKKLISVFGSEKNFKVFCSKCWWGDGWDCSKYYLDYDPNKNFFDQLKELQKITPFMEKVNDYSTLVNSEYVNHAGSCKNCHLIFNADFNENVYYSSTIESLRDSSDCMMMNKTELSYECIGGDGSRIYFSENCPQSVNVWYSKDCIGCNDCFGCVNLNKQSYHIFNKPYSREEYKNKIKEMELDKYSSHLKIQENIYDFWNKFPRRYMYGRMNKNVSGDYIYNSKNAKNCYEAVCLEDCAYCQFITLPTFRDCYDFTNWGNGVEMCVETINCGEGGNNVNYCAMVWSNVRNIEYSFFVLNSKNCFGCVNLRNKEYCILNKQYSKEEYIKLREEIISNLEKNSYVDSKGRVFKYGEFFPYDLSLFSYNGSIASQYFPLDKKEIEKSGFSYTEIPKPNYLATVSFQDIPDSIKDIPDNFSEEILQCSCGKFYRIISGELQLLKRFILPIPRKCPDCRHMARIKRVNPPFLYDRNCDKCGIEIKTSYAPDRPEIVYCVKCYQQEVY